MILANQMRRHGTAEGAHERLNAEFRELFFPQEAAWQAKAIADARQAFESILRAEGYW